MEKIILAMVLLLFLIGCAPKDVNRVCYGRECFEVELAITSAEHNKGLMDREHLDEDKGMLFIFQEVDEYGFWMKNTLIPLDIIWIDENKEVVFISKDTPPCKEDPCPSYNPRADAKYVLELNAGIADEIGLEKGDTLIINVG